MALSNRNESKKLRVLLYGNSEEKSKFIDALRKFNTMPSIYNDFININIDETKVLIYGNAVNSSTPIGDINIIVACGTDVESVKNNTRYQEGKQQIIPFFGSSPHQFITDIVTKTFPKNPEENKVSSKEEQEDVPVSSKDKKEVTKGNSSLLGIFGKLKEKAFKSAQEQNKSQKPQIINLPGRNSAIN